MWVSRKKWDDLKAKVRDLEDRLEEVERGVGLGIRDNGTLYACGTRFKSDFKANEIVERLFAKSGLKARHVHGPIIE